MLDIRRHLLLVFCQEHLSEGTWPSRSLTETGAKASIFLILIYGAMGLWGYKAHGVMTLIISPAYFITTFMRHSKLLPALALSCVFPLGLCQWGSSSCVPGTTILEATTCSPGCVRPSTVITVTTTLSSPPNTLCPEPTPSKRAVAARAPANLEQRFTCEQDRTITTTQTYPCSICTSATTTNTVTATIISAGPCHPHPSPTTKPITTSTAKPTPPKPTPTPTHY
ncbi:hypothetical protein BOTBODRAFT_320920 [Botryobasidium botryosum FD-172 SS1]|uniref:Uncharacterized protein n=1 Tax=Botryobasidium botryosum (strain FD-172 SS1) TaxID=930990 RepID=A0A067N1Q8_BOTB1|nr:hypothetical protein BOTBODRAFT_320920 [Botryobasidium botryosum FD-172 SS1]